MSCAYSALQPSRSFRHRAPYQPRREDQRATRLPNAHLCIVSREKVVDYLLDPTHRYGASKERFFTDFGFRSKEWEVFAAALRRHGQRYQVAEVKETGFGPRYEVDGELEVPDGRRPQVRTVWQVDEGETAPQLITAHPLEVS